MADPKLDQSLRQKRMNALVAKYLHQFRRDGLNRFNLIADLLALAVPIAYFPIRYLAKDTEWTPLVEALWELSAAALLIITIIKLVRRTQERAEDHTKLMGQNISAASQISFFSKLYQDGSVNNQVINTYLLPSDLDQADAEALGDVKPAEKQAAYRAALQEENAVCPQCNASPWQYTPGSCQLCGNTPRQGGTP